MTMTDLELDLWQSPRVRETDPQTSHDAADRSQHTISALRRDVLWVVQMHEPMIGSHLNEQYRIALTRDLVVRAAWDSPRKRAGELIEDGLLEVVGVVDGERSFRLTDKGRKAVNA